MTAFVAAAVATGLLFGRNASAQETGFAVDRFEPSERGSDWFTLDSLDLRGDARPAFGVVGEYNARPLVIYDNNGNIKESVVRNQFILHAGASFVFLNRFRIAADMPFQLFADGHQGTLDGVTYFPPANDQALGDLRLSADARLCGEYGDVLTLAIGAQVSLPTGSRENYLSDGQVRFMPRAVVAGDVGPIASASKVTPTTPELPRTTKRFPLPAPQASSRGSANAASTSLDSRASVTAKSDRSPKTAHPKDALKIVASNSTSSETTNETHSIDRHGHVFFRSERARGSCVC